MKPFKDVWYESSDGLQLHARDYADAESPLTLLCLHGLTRNAADFEPLAELLHPRYRLVVAEQRGRGQSAWDSDPSHYQPSVYVEDMFRLIDHLGLSDMVLVGTSMGGLMAMMMNAMKPGTFRGVIFNDIGPEVNPEGLARIKAYVGKTAAVATWDDAQATVRQLNRAAFPDYDERQWRAFTRRLYGEDASGVPRLLYDPNIAAPADEEDGPLVPPDLWPLFEALAPVPVLLIRGALSDILSRESARAMASRKPDMRWVDVPRVGHAPVLDEPQAIGAIRDFLAELGRDWTGGVPTITH